MIYHILNGDALLDRFKDIHLQGEIMVMRECLIDGDLRGNSLNEFWQSRSAYLSAAYSDNYVDYFKNVVPEFEKLMVAPGQSEFNLWFGYDLFCNTNLWFLLSLLQSLDIEKQIFIVYPSYLSKDRIWEDFGSASTKDLNDAFQNRIRLSDGDLQLGADLWVAYKNNDRERLEALSETKSPCFPYLEQVCKAHLDRFENDLLKGRPERTLHEVISDISSSDFPAIFTEFSKREGVYGFGDLQVKKIMDQMQDRS